MKSRFVILLRILWMVATVGLMTQHSAPLSAIEQSPVEPGAPAPRDRVAAYRGLPAKWRAEASAAEEGRLSCRPKCWLMGE